MAEIKEWERHRGLVCDTVRGFDVVECETCGFKHILPIPPPEKLVPLYAQEYYSAEKPLYLERDREDLEWWNLFYDGLYDFFEENVLGVGRRVLDVGSGPGFFLLRGKQRGWQTLGVEPSTLAAAHARNLGLEILNDFLDSWAPHKLGLFHVVHLQEVLEHTPHPAEMLSLAAQLLHPGGLLCVIVPNDYNPLQQLLCEHLGYQPWWVAPPHHINYFSFESLGRLIRLQGLEVVWETTTFPMEVFLLMGESYVGNDSLGRRMHGMRKAFELNLARAKARNFLGSFYSRLAQEGLGRECVIIARNPANSEPILPGLEQVSGGTG